MKTETQITEENIKSWKFTKPQDKELWRLNIYLSKCQQHKASCERFLEFLEDFKGALPLAEPDEVYYSLRDMIEEKITDLKQAINSYSENGI